MCFINLVLWHWKNALKLLNTLYFPISNINKFSIFIVSCLVNVWWNQWQMSWHSAVSEMPVINMLSLVTVGWMQSEIRREGWWLTWTAFQMEWQTWSHMYALIIVVSIVVELHSSVLGCKSFAIKPFEKCSVTFILVAIPHIQQINCHSLHVILTSY